MKKIFIAIMAIAAVSFTSCGGNSGEASDNDSTATEEVAEEVDLQTLEEAINNGDSEAVQSEISKLKDIIANLDSAEAVKYAYKLQEFAANHKDDLKKLTEGELTIDDIVGTVSNLKSLGKEAGDAATSDANTVSNQVKAAAESAKETIKEEAKAKADEATEAAKAKATEEANKAINNAADALRNKLKK